MPTACLVIHICLHWCLLGVMVCRSWLHLQVLGNLLLWFRLCIEVKCVLCLCISSLFLAEDNGRT